PKVDLSTMSYRNLKKIGTIRKQTHSDAFNCVFNPESLCCEEDFMEDDDPDYQPPHDNSIEAGKLSK
ncbi:unnamed protein product, partial [Rotaria socialis]